MIFCGIRNAVCLFKWAIYVQWYIFVESFIKNFVYIMLVCCMVMNEYVEPYLYITFTDMKRTCEVCFWATMSLCKKYKSSLPPDVIDMRLILQLRPSRNGIQVWKIFAALFQYELMVSVRACREAVSLDMWIKCMYLRKGVKCPLVFLCSFPRSCHMAE